MCAASAALVWAIASVPYVPTHDGPSHILSGHIENHFDDPGTIYSRHLSRAPQYASRGFALLFRPFERWLGWMAATKATLAITALAGALGTAWLVWSIDPRRRWNALLAFAFALPWTLYMGFFSYFVATTFGIGVIAFVVGRDFVTLRQRIVLGLALALHAHLHVFSALVTASTVWLILFLRAPAERRIREAGIAALITAPVAAVLLWATLDVGTYRQMSDQLDWRFGERLFTLPQLAAPGPIWKGLLALVVISAGVTSAWMRRKRGASVHRDELALMCCAGGWLVIAMIAPLHLPGWQYFSPRFLQPAIAMGLALLGGEALSERRRQVFAIGATVVALLSLERARALHASMYSGCADSFSGLSLPIERTKVQLGLVVDPHCGVPAEPEKSPTPYVSPLEHVAALYATAHGGTLPFMFVGSPSIHAFMPRDIGPEEEMPIPPGEGLPRAIAGDDVARRGAIALVAADAQFYESFLVFGARPEEIDAVLAMGFSSRFRQGSFLIAEPRGCAIDLVITNPPPNGSLEVAYGPVPASEPISTRQIALAGGTEGPLRVPIRHAICGDVWLRPIWSSGTAPERFARCERTGPDARLIFPAKAGAEIRCTLSRAAGGG